MNLSLLGLPFGCDADDGGFVVFYWFMCLCLWIAILLLLAAAWLFGLIALCLVGLLVCLLFDLGGYARFCWLWVALGFGWLMLVFGCALFAWFVVWFGYCGLMVLGFSWLW